MADKFVMSSRLAAELDHAFERNGWSAAEVKLLSQGDKLSRMRDVLRGAVKIVDIDHYIGHVNPYVPDGWKLSVHKHNDKLKWNPENLQLYVHENQIGSKGMMGHILFEGLWRKRILNANVLDYLLSHLEIIPESWKWKDIFFWGTLYNNEKGDLCVRQLLWRGDRWDWSQKGVHEQWHKNSIAVLDGSSS